MAEANSMPMPSGATGVLVLASGDVIWGRGFGAEGQAVGEVCFHTAMTGYQEIMTDPSFAGQIINFTFPHIGNVGANPDDIEADDPHALGMIVREDVTEPSNFRSTEHLDVWMKKHARIGLSGIDTRALTRRIRMAGAPNGVIAHSAEGQFDIPLLLEMARAWPGLEGMDLAITVTTETHFGWEGGVWRWASAMPRAGKKIRGPMSSRSIMARSATSSATSSPPAPRLPCCRLRRPMSR
jgi:carbamoyl-phosphate synthase small subunit